MEERILEIRTKDYPSCLALVSLSGWASAGPSSAASKMWGTLLILVLHKRHDARVKGWKINSLLRWLTSGLKSHSFSHKLCLCTAAQRWRSRLCFHVTPPIQSAPWSSGSVTVLRLINFILVTCYSAPPAGRDLKPTKYDPSLACTEHNQVTLSLTSLLT